MSEALEARFHEAMLNIYRRAKSEAKYNATVFLQMVVDNGGLQAARRLINADTPSTGYTALWERGRLDLTVEAMVLDSPQFQPLFTEEELTKCEVRLREYGYQPYPAAFRRPAPASTAGRRSSSFVGPFNSSARRPRAAPQPRDRRQLRRRDSRRGAK